MIPWHTAADVTDVMVHRFRLAQGRLRCAGYPQGALDDEPTMLFYADPEHEVRALLEAALTEEEAA